MFSLRQTFSWKLFTYRVVIIVSLPIGTLGDTPEQPRLEPVGIVDVPGFTIEIVGYDAQQRVLVGTDPHWKSLDVFDVEAFDPLALTMFDLGGAGEPGPQGVDTVYEPTSVAVHPTQPVALVSVLGRSVEKRGWLLGVDLRRGEDTLGVHVLWQGLGFHPDGIAVSPDGRWALVACEGEGSPDTPGEVWAVDLAGLNADRRVRDGALPAFSLPGLAELMQQPAGGLEPEIVAFDPASRFAVVSLQENDAFVVVALPEGGSPRLVGRTLLADGANPDGIDVLDGVPGPDGRPGALVAVAEEGRFNHAGQTTGNTVSFYWLDPAALDQSAVLMSRTDVRPWVDAGEPDKRRDPESVKLLRAGGRTLAILTIERGDYLLGLDVTDPSHPVLFDKVKVGDRPEGLILVDHPSGILIVTGDEGNRGPGTISVTRLVVE